ncbi:MAG: hypothetical protein NWE93_03580 [Candidatus Bathyarchaeota archaeon]|nr:hypothetical protein [Candidatus Bathyarchaeota archaeon]
MTLRYLPILGKALGLALIFNSLLTAAYGVTLFNMFGRFFPAGQEYYPLLLSGNIFLVVALVGLLNVVPCTLLSRTFETGRFLFHHYVYGALVIAAATIYLIFLPFDVWTTFLVYNTQPTVNVARVLILVGAAMIVDDLPDVHPSINTALMWTKQKAAPTSGVLSVLHLVAAGASVYVAAVMAFLMIQHPSMANTANLILTLNLTLTCIIAFVALKKDAWTKLKD